MDVPLDQNGSEPGPILENEEDFLQDVETFQRSRGVAFDREGKVAGRPAPMYQLFKMITSMGGYDAVTATRMQWRDVCARFGYPAAHEGAMSYQMKQLYYKNLLAYEIEKYWHEVAPPKEILESLTAKGGEVRRRAREARGIYDDRLAAKDLELILQQPQQNTPLTPKPEAIELDDQGSASRYPSRLRQQPRPTHAYQPDMTPPRRVTRFTNSPQPTQRPAPHHPPQNFRDPNFKWEDYEPRPAMPLTLQPVVTPGSNPDIFYQRKHALRQRPIVRPPLPQELLRYSVPPTTFAGPNIYIRCVQGLRSEIKSEQDFALHHLVKVSHERGDKFKFEGFPYLAEGLMEKVVEVTELACGVKFQVSYLETRGQAAPNTINAVYGTPDLASKISDLSGRLDVTQIHTGQTFERLEKLNETALVLRNMVTLEENAYFLSKMALFRDVLIILISLPVSGQFDEMRQYGLDMSEMVTKYWDMKPMDDLYRSLVRELDSLDRGKIIPALRAIYRFDAEADRIHPLTDIPLSTIQRLTQFCVLEDEELVEAVVNFLYVWTASPDNLAWILKAGPRVFPEIAFHLCQLLLNDARPAPTQTLYERAAPNSTGYQPAIPIVPADLYAQLLHFAENERSSKWLKCCFEESPTSDVTQISIWQAYSQRFAANQPVVAAEFIKNVSATFTGAQAQVVQGPEPNKPRFIIKGIRPRRVLLDLNGRPYLKCHWHLPLPTNTDAGVHSDATYAICATWHPNADSLVAHMITEHFKIARTAEDQLPAFADVVVPEEGWRCQWWDCERLGSPTILRTPQELVRHVRQHIPENAEIGRQLIYQYANETIQPSEDKVTSHMFYQTPIDEKQIPCGIPYMSCLLLMNLARYIGRYGGNERQRKELMAQMFHPAVWDSLFDMWSKQKTIAALIYDLIELVRAGQRSERKAVASA